LGGCASRPQNGTTADAGTTAALHGDRQVPVQPMPGARFTKYLTTILRLSYDNAEVTIDLRRTSIVYKTSYEGRKALLTYDLLAKLYGRPRQCSQISLRYS